MQGTKSHGKLCKAHPWRGFRSTENRRNTKPRVVRMHSQSRHYSVETWLTCERTSFRLRRKFGLIQDHLNPNLIELAWIVKMICRLSFHLVGSLVRNHCGRNLAKEALEVVYQFLKIGNHSRMEAIIVIKSNFIPSRIRGTPGNDFNLRLTSVPFSPFTQCQLHRKPSQDEGKCLLQSRHSFGGIRHIGANAACQYAI